MLPKSMSPKTCIFSSIFARILMLVAKANLQNLCDRAMFLLAFSIFRHLQFGNGLVSKDYFKERLKPAPNHEKMQSATDLFLDINFFRFWAPFWQLWEGSWASVGRLWALQMTPKSLIFYTFVVFVAAIQFSSDLARFREGLRRVWK